jgi:integrase
MKRMLTDRLIRSLTPTERIEIADAIVPGLALRVSPTSKTFVLIHRYPGSRNPTRRSLGRYGAITLQDARLKARQWLEMIDHGKDPAIELERERLAEARKRADNFEAVAKAFLEQKVSQERRRYDVEYTLRRFIKAWGNRPIVDIERRDVRLLIEPVATHSPYMARNMLVVIKRLFSWVVRKDIYGLEASPCEQLKAKDIVGILKPRQRVLSEDELRALHRVASEMPYPHGPLLLMLLYTGQRHMDCAGATWSEISLERKEWIIPAGRFKSEVSHLVPLSSAVVELLCKLPHIAGSDRLFPLPRGIVNRPLAHLRSRMLEILRERNPEATLERFTVHDIRRTMRTRLTQLRIQTEVAEAVIGHGKRGLERHYNLYEYQTEKAHALELWASWLRNLVEPPATNVVALKA